jgi:HPt (histidine-containing phosphotransfer) domain-containing protein
MNAFLPKPFTEKMLLDTMLSVLPVKTTDINTMGKPDDEPEHPASVITGTEGAGTDVNLTNIYHLANHDVSFVIQLVNSFIEGTEQGLTGLQEAINCRDLQAVNEIAHRISSPCRHVGADGLYSRLKLIEQQSANPENIGILAKLSSDSTREFLEIKKGLLKHLEKI